MAAYVGVFNFMDCGTIHVTPADLDLLVRSKALSINYPYREGFWVYSAGEEFQQRMKETKAAGFSEGMVKALEYAHSRGCWWLRLDADGTEFEFLPRFEKEWEAAPANTSFTVTMGSDEFGCEDFHYESMEDALSGLRRLLGQDKLLDDGVERTFTIRKTEG